LLILIIFNINFFLFVFLSFKFLYGWWSGGVNAVVTKIPYIQSFAEESGYHE